MSLEGKKVLVTGGTGFIGSHLVQKLVLEHQAHVRVLVRNFVNAARIARFPIEMMPGNLGDPLSVQKAVENCDVVFHCAYDFAGNTAEQKRVGVVGTQNICDAVIKSGVQRMVHLSTFAVYAPTLDGDLTELSPWPKTTDSYVAIKRQAERLVLSLHEKQELPVVVLQPTLVYGPFSPHWTLATVQSLKTGLVPLTHDGVGYCNLVYIDDLIEAMVLAATQPDVAGETFLVSGEEPATWRAYYSRFEEMLGIKATTERSEEELLEMIRDRDRANKPAARLLRLARQPNVYPCLLSLPGISGSLRLLQKRLTARQWESLKSQFLNGNAPVSRNNGVSMKPIHLPGRALLALYRSKTSVCIDKAKRRLGYAPRFSFEQGMDLTGRFVQWAGLAGPN